jgi:hypothetical protein
MDIDHYLGFLFITAFGRLQVTKSLTLLGPIERATLFHHQKRMTMAKTLIKRTVVFYVVIPCSFEVVPDVSKEATTFIFTTEALRHLTTYMFSIFHRDCCSNGSLLGLSPCSVIALFRRFGRSYHLHFHYRSFEAPDNVHVLNFSPRLLFKWQSFGSFAV